MDNLRSTKRQRELLNFVDNFIQGHGYGPSYREIMRALGYKSVSTVAVHINGLIARGYLNKRDNSARSIEVVSTRIEAPLNNITTSPAQEKWLVDAIKNRFEMAKTSNNKARLTDELYVLIGALKILGLDGAHEAMKVKLAEIVGKSGS